MNLRPCVSSLHCDPVRDADAGPDAAPWTLKSQVAPLSPTVCRSASLDATVDVETTLPGVVMEVHRHGQQPRIGSTPVEPEPAEPGNRPGRRRTAWVPLRLSEAVIGPTEKAAACQGTSMNASCGPSSPFRTATARDTTGPAGRVAGSPAPPG